MKKIADLVIHNFAFGGDGTALLPDGKVCFVPRAVPGDRIRAEIVVEKKNFARAVIREILEPSSDRKESLCLLRTADTPCPACVYAEVDYAVELQAKQQQLEFFMRKFSPEVIHPPYPSPHRTGYRNKISLTCENGVAGYRGEDNTTLIPVRTCPLAQNAICEKMSLYRPAADAKRIVYRWTPFDGVAMPTEPGSPEYLTEQIGNERFKVPVRSFFQVNMPVAEELSKRAMGYVNRYQPKHFVELYSGSGIFSVLAAGQNPALECIGVELDGDAVRTARKNAEEHGVAARCRFYSDDAARFPGKIKGVLPEETLLLTDPPRTGMSKEVVQGILAWKPSVIVYISCAPDMLRRDLQILSEVYQVKEMALLDMFPCTAHFESVTLLEKKA